MHYTKLLLSASAKLVATAKKRHLKVALVGAPNAGKSTLLNKIIGTDISCASSKVHTTRNNVLGVYTEDSTQLEFVDTPGVINRQHLLRHRLEDSLLVDPEKASVESDIIVVLVDASNRREQRALHKGVISLLHESRDKESILVLNKVDLVKDKRALLDISTRLTQGCLNGKCTIKRSELSRLPRSRILELNLSAHLNRDQYQDERVENKAVQAKPVRPKHKYVIELDEPKYNESIDYTTPVRNPDSIGYKNFSSIFSISALNNDGVNHIRDHLLSKAVSVETWPHGPDYVTNQSTQDMVHGIIRGKVLDYVKDAVPYLLRYNYLQCEYDDMGSLHINLVIKCPEKYMVPAVIGTQGVHILRILEDSRDMIENALRCDVKLNINVQGPPSRNK